MSFDIPTLNAAGQIQSPAVLAQIRKIAEDAARASVPETPEPSGGNVLRGPGRPDMPQTTEGAIDEERLWSEDPSERYAPGLLYYPEDQYDGATLWRHDGRGNWRVLEGFTSTFVPDLPSGELDIAIYRTPGLVRVSLSLQGVKGPLSVSWLVPSGFQSYIPYEAVIPMRVTVPDSSVPWGSSDIDGEARFGYGSYVNLNSDAGEDGAQYASVDFAYPADSLAWPHKEDSRTESGNET